jgi:hypothetical protein
MASSVTRIESSETMSAKNVPSSATVQYLVTGENTANGAIEAVKAENILPFGSAHPDGIDGDSLKAVEYNATQRIGSGNDRGWIVSVGFRLDGAGANFQEPPITEPDYSTAELAVVKREIEAPYFRKQKVFSRVGTEVVETFRWVEDSQKFTLNTITLRVVVNVDSTKHNIAAFGEIAEQTNKIHTLPTANGVDQKKWLFNGGSSSQISVNTWRIAYEWWYDPGNPALPVPEGAIQEDLILPPERPQYTNYFKDLVTVGIPPLTGLTQVPVIRISEPLIEDAQGYRDLPGIPFE